MKDRFTKAEKIFKLMQKKERQVIKLNDEIIRLSEKYNDLTKPGFFIKSK